MRGKAKGKRPAPRHNASNRPSPSRPAAGFSMRDEGRYTTQLHANGFANGFGAGSKLRDKPVEFISAGFLQGTLEEKEVTKENEVGEVAEAREGLVKMTLRARSRSTSSNSEEEVVFKGRNITTAATATTETTAAPAVQQEQSDASSGDGDDGSDDDDSVLLDGFRSRLGGKSPWETNTLPWQSRSTPGVGWMPRPPRADYSTLNGANGADAAAMQDYIDNVQAQEAQEAQQSESDGSVHVAPTFVRRDMHLGDPDEWRVGDGKPDSQPSDVLGSDGEDGEGSLVDASEDERLARVLAKQEELGLGGDDIVLFDCQDYGGSTDSDQKSSHASRFVASRRPRQNAFPSASLMADVLDADPYNGFDIMDFDRPSLRAKNKGRRGPGPPELSDSDLNDALQSAYSTNRATKRLKKAEREEMRKQGLLGRKDKALPDLAVKYKDGYTIPQIIGEIRLFMESDISTCALPPMQKYHRKVIHNVAKGLQLGSKSRGSGQTRFTMLSKTTRTIAYSEEVFERIAQRKYGGFNAGKDRAGATRDRPVVSYRDGEQVGATAPELGPENRGRAMLEKMGWKKGTALGALDNKGILTPIVHTVKTTKAGLQ